MRGQARDYDDWADVHECKGWTFDDVLPVFKRQKANQRLSDPFHAVEVHPMTMRPKSCGRLGLTSLNPVDQPKFTPHVFSDEGDMDTLRHGVRFTREIFDAPELRETVGDEVWPVPDISSLVGPNRLDDTTRAHALFPTQQARAGWDLWKRIWSICSCV